jgi:cell division protein FtsI/penicillin-binding protein 2
MPEEIAHEVEHMMESVALPGGGGVKAAVRDYRVAVKTGTAKKIDDTGNMSINTWPIPQALRPPAIRVLRWWW